MDLPLELMRNLVFQLVTKYHHWDIQFQQPPSEARGVGGSLCYRAEVLLNTTFSEALSDMLQDRLMCRIPELTHATPTTLESNFIFQKGIELAQFWNHRQEHLGTESQD